MSLSIRVTPRAGRSTIEGLGDGFLRVRLAAPPVDGAANDELVRVIAQALGVRRAAVHLISGHRSRTKVVEVEGVSAEHVIRVTASESA